MLTTEMTGEGIVSATCDGKSRMMIREWLIAEDGIIPI